MHDAVAGVEGDGETLTAGVEGDGDTLTAGVEGDGDTLTAGGGGDGDTLTAGWSLAGGAAVLLAVEGEEGGAAKESVGESVRVTSEGGVEWMVTRCEGGKLHSVDAPVVAVDVPVVGQEGRAGGLHSVAGGAEGGSIQ